MSVVSVVVAIIGFALATVWGGVGIAGLAGRLQRNKWLGVRNDDTMRSAKAFTVANRAAGPGMVAAAVMTAVGAGLGLAIGGLWGTIFVVAAIVVSMLVIGIVSGIGIRAAAVVPPEDDDTGCGVGCCSGGDEASSCADDHAAQADDPASDCGQSSCGSCALSGMCTNETAQA
ncbi:SdpI family protein [Gordonia sp. TBRC 11910]|uniref:SdpI family protein n=1 Tax=Gordonia asplenii TaxID=2725283 RepID=A0A848L4B5_9ACTN|nr:SdpI family protein [Gordonia asplenii]NMO03433.1 SdpI family protein [Gordonia asplenii]